MFQSFLTNSVWDTNMNSKYVEGCSCCWSKNLELYTLNNKAINRQETELEL
jgi:hypothetical protein